MPLSPAERDRAIVETLVSAYLQGVFPMGDPDTGELAWYQPPTRARISLQPGGFHVSRSLRRRLRQRRFRLTTDADFAGVIRGCAAPHSPHSPLFHARNRSWIDERLIAAYTTLHRAGFAHSIEAWLDAADGSATLVGGIYGVHIGSAFFAESKFCRPELGGTDASKVCLAALVGHLQRRGFAMLDVQFTNPHLEQFGVDEQPLEKFLADLEAAARTPAAWEPFEAMPPS